MEKRGKLTIVLVIGIILGVSLPVTAQITGMLVTDAENITLNSDKTSATDVKKALDELYLKSEIELDEEVISCDANVAPPKITGDLIPVTISRSGTVRKANPSEEWYNYCDKKWANAVILMDKTKTYNNGELIPESNIESYFVWIPKYKYKLWNVGVTDANPGPHKIDIIFDTTNTTNIEGESCATPLTSGGTGACNNGEYMTHPAFITMGVNGFWVGKFETGYKGATTTEEAEITSSDSSKIIIKPNVYSWRNNTVYNFFVASYNYNRSLNSHMMKNTEWGAVAYLSHSAYGTNGQININNDSSHLTGKSSLLELDQHNKISGLGDEYNRSYNTKIGYLASTTGNITGIYDMSGGAYEYMSGYIDGNLGSSGFTTTTISNYNNTYFDVYNASSDTTTYQYRILGDATGEMGPIDNYKYGDNTSKYHNWYGDISHFVCFPSSYSFFLRGGGYSDGVLAGQFYFNPYTGVIHPSVSFRLVIAP